jgi:hypothetical protein
LKQIEKLTLVAIEAIEKLTLVAIEAIEKLTLVAIELQFRLVVSSSNAVALASAKEKNLVHSTVSRAPRKELNSLRSNRNPSRTQSTMPSRYSRT